MPFIKRSGYVAEHRNPGPSTQRACANCHVLHLASALSHGSRAWVEVGMNVGDGFDATKENKTAVQLYIDHRRDCKTSAASVALYPGCAGKIKPEHKYFVFEDKCQSIRLTDNSARAHMRQLGHLFTFCTTSILLLSLSLSNCNMTFLTTE